jgi:hypothetical protein
MTAFIGRREFITPLGACRRGRAAAATRFLGRLRGPPQPVRPARTVLSFGRQPSGWRDQVTAFIGHREFITLLGGAAAARPLAAQTPRRPVAGQNALGARHPRSTRGTK